MTADGARGETWVSITGTADSQTVIVEVRLKHSSSRVCSSYPRLFQNESIFCNFKEVFLKIADLWAHSIVDHLHGPGQHTVHTMIEVDQRSRL